MALTFDSSGKSPAELAAAGTVGISTGSKNQLGSLYQNFRAGQLTGTVDLNPANLQPSLELNIHDPMGSASRGQYGSGTRVYPGGWAGLPNTTQTTPGTYDSAYHGYNQFFMTVAQNFDPFMQRKEAIRPHWWLNRIPRAAYVLGAGTTQETRIYRGGLSTYVGLGQWEDLAPNLTDGGGSACGVMPYETYNYSWEAISWTGKKAAWGSDPICIDILKFVPKAVEQIGWILETGVKFGTDMQNVWNRDMFVYQTVMAGRSFVMSNSYRGEQSARYVYNPFCRFRDNKTGVRYTTSTDGDLKVSAVDVPFIVIDASVDMEPLNFDVLNLVRMQLKRRCPESAVGRIGNEPMFALAVSEEEIENYIRGNEEQRKYWIEGNPAALIKGFDFAPNTFKRWMITGDNEQLRFKLVKYIPSYDASIAETYGNVGKKEFTTSDVAGASKAVWIATAVMPEIIVRAGINGAGIPGPNPAYDLAEVGLAPIFMQKVFTNQFVPDFTNIGNGTYFGPKRGLNGKWAWYNIQSKENPDQRVGNFAGEIQIVPKPDLCIYDCISFVYRRCEVPLRSLCPAENFKVNQSIDQNSTVSTTAAAAAAVASGNEVVTLFLTRALAVGTGGCLNVVLHDTTASSPGADQNLTAYVLGVENAGAKMTVQVVGATFAASHTYAIAAGSAVTVAA